MERLIRYIFMVAAGLAVVSFVCACGSGSSSSSDQGNINSGILATNYGSGFSYMQGNVRSGAVESRFVGKTTVNLFQIVSGIPLPTPFSTAQTDNTGLFSIAVPLDNSPFLIVATGLYGPPTGQNGQNITVSLSAAAVNAESFPATITLLSQAAANYALTLGGLTPDNIIKAGEMITSYALSVDPLITPVIDYTSSQSALANGAQRLLSAEFGALYFFQQAQGYTPGEVVDAIVASLTSGATILSTKGGGYIEDSTDPISRPTDNVFADSAGGIHRDFYKFLESDSNATGLKNLNDFISALQQPMSSQQTTTTCTTPQKDNSTARNALRQSHVQNWQSTGKVKSYWGPKAASLPYISVPPGCDCKEWKTQQVLSAIDMYVKMGINYCHHHIPGWTPPAEFRISGTCSSKNTTDNGTMLWQGVDCSNFTSWYYNIALGVAKGSKSLNSDIATQACEANDNTSPVKDPNNTSCYIDGAPGVVLNYNNQNFDNISSKLQAGDLLYIMGGSGSDKITHVITWTGKKVGTGANEIPESSLAPDAKSYLGTGQKLAGSWVIADSHYAGPGYRPFVGWYRNSLSHIRRIIGQANVPAADIIDPSKSTDFVYLYGGTDNATCWRKSFN
ncbi:MAG: hypothetical protein HQL01_01575 [Nitrospirae bacterium]|nr:hypothetical protein [Nitrospirota bacterium]